MDLNRLEHLKLLVAIINLLETIKRAFQTMVKCRICNQSVIVLSVIECQNCFHKCKTHLICRKLF